MVEIYSKGMDRRELEKRILELARSVPVEDIEWLSSQQLYEFIGAWWALAKYYTENNDTVIGVELVSEFVNFERLLRRLMHDNTVDPEIRQRAEDQLLDLDAGIDEVFKEAISHLNK
jgi:hypothetical protein